MTGVHCKLSPDMQVCQVAAHAHCPQHAVHPFHREPVVTEAMERKRKAAISRG